MQLYDKILGHLHLLQEMKKAGVSDTFVKDYKEEALFNLCRKVRELDAKDEILSMDTEAVEYLVKDPGFLLYLVRLLREGVSNAMRAGWLLMEAKKDILSENYSYEEIASVLADSQVKTARTYVYLKYFSYNPLSEAEKEFLMDGLDALDTCSAFSIEELTDTERSLLMEPVFSSSFLRERIQARGFWKQLENPAYRTLLGDLSIYMRPTLSLGEAQAEELWLHTEEIQEGLKEVFQKLPADEIGNFLALWLENEALVYDLGRLKRRLPDLACEMERGASDTGYPDGTGAARKVKFTRNQVAYLNYLYGDLLDGVNLGQLSQAQKNLLVYAITHKKRHFLTMVKEHFEDFTYLRPFHLLLDADTYEHYLNVNTLNPRNLKESGHLCAVCDESKPFLKRRQYTFEEVKLFSEAKSRYVRLYHLLAYPKSDDRLRVIREVIKRGCLLGDLEEERYAKLGAMLSQKPISRWMSQELKHVEQLSYQQAASLLSVWDQVERFIPEIQTGHQADFLLHNLEAIEEIPDFQTLTEQMVENDTTWKNLNARLKIGEGFLLKNREGVNQFLFDGGAEIFAAFLSGTEESEWEKARRLCTAEITGRFREVKYYKDDLEREISLRLSKETQHFWMRNTETKKNGARLWEEDRLLPIMQIGESLGHTCLSYRDGKYKKCLLSCFDANKKVLYVSYDGQLVFRAMIRLTKGAFSRRPGERQNMQFADIIQEDMADGTEDRKKEYLTLFLERPYFKGISEDKEKEVVNLAVGMLQKKAKQLQAELVLSDSYRKLILEEKKFIRAKYYMYISASKNGKQYLDSLGGMASVQDEGSYEEGYFLLQESFVNPKTGKQ